MQRWEYCELDWRFYSDGETIFSVNGQDIPQDVSKGKSRFEILNMLGQDGWELVSIETNNVTRHPDRAGDRRDIFIPANILIFKRPIETEYASMAEEYAANIVGVQSAVEPVTVETVRTEISKSLNYVFQPIEPMA